MNMRRIVIGAVVLTMLCLTMALTAQAQPGSAAAPGKLYNTAKAKLMAGKPIFGGTIDKAIYSEKHTSTSLDSATSPFLAP